MSNQLSSINTKKLTRIIDHLDNIFPTGFNVLNKFYGKSNHITTNVYASYFQRFNSCFESTSILLKEFSQNKFHLEYPISILLRASLLDCLTLLYLRSYYEEINSESNKTHPNFDSEFGKLLSSQLRRILSLSKQDKESTRFNAESFKKTVDIMMASYSYLFNDPENVDYNNPTKSLIYGDYKKHEIKNSKIRRRLDEVYKDSPQTHLHIFYLYDIYSKHDHFGLMSIALLKMDINEVFENFTWALYYIIDGYYYSLEFLRQEEEIEMEYKSLRLNCGLLGGTIRSKNY